MSAAFSLALVVMGISAVAVGLAAEHPEVAAGLNNLGVALIKLYRFEEARHRSRAGPPASRITSACLNTLSFMAPRNCTPKNGPKRRSARRRNWLRSLRESG